MQKQLLKDCILTSIKVFEEVKQESGVVFSSEDIVKTAISLYIQENHNSKTNGNGGTNQNSSSSENGNGKGNGGVPATDPQLNFLKRYGGKSMILVGLTKQKASELIQGIKANWK